MSGKRFTSTDPSPGDTTNVLLAKLLQRIGGYAQPGDSDNNLLARIIEEFPIDFATNQFQTIDNIVLFTDSSMVTVLHGLGFVPRFVTVVAKVTEFHGSLLAGTEIPVDQIISTDPTKRVGVFISAGAIDISTGVPFDDWTDVLTVSNNNGGTMALDPTKIVWKVNLLR